MQTGFSDIKTVNQIYDFLEENIATNLYGDIPEAWGLFNRYNKVVMRSSTTVC